MSVTFILGGARSGKSAFAQKLAESSTNQLYYIATATGDDEEMQARIQHHQDQRSERWELREEPLYLTEILQQYDSPDRVLLVDCLTLWLTNLILHEDEDLLTAELDRLLSTLQSLKGDIILISNEVGCGIIPLGPLNRQFCDHAGRLHQTLATLCDNVIFVVAGLPQVLKGNIPTL